MNNTIRLDASHITCPYQRSREEADADNSRVVVGYVMIGGSQTPYTGTYGDYIELVCREHAGFHTVIKHDPDTWSIERSDGDFSSEIIGRYTVTSA